MDRDIEALTHPTEGLLKLRDWSLRDREWKHPKRGVNETTYTYKYDKGEVFPVGTVSKTNVMPGIVQDRDFTDVEIAYEWNKFGYRYKEPNKKKVIAFIGCGAVTGVGLPLEETYPYIVAEQMNMPYVTFTEHLFDEFLEVLVNMSHIYEYDTIFLCESMFITRTQYPYRFIQNKIPFSDKKIYMQMLVESQANLMLTVDKALGAIFPKTNIYMYEHPRANTKLLHKFIYDIEFDHIKEKIVPAYEGMCVDLDRSCEAYGKRTYQNFAQSIMDQIG